MQDRFKFRAWDKDNGKYINNVQECVGYPGNECDRCFGYILDNSDYEVEQCTGLKDKNGELIYEGDIVEATDGSKTKGRAIYDTTFGVYMTKLLENNQGIALEQYVDLDTLKLKLKVIGNIHENPELLEG